MVTFETVLKKLKYEVLKEVAILAKENRISKEEIEKIHQKIITGDRPQYRCCIYKERAIVTERAKLAANCLPDGDENDTLIQIGNEDQIIYVIESACDQCPIDKYSVTEACRGCIANRCMEVCPAKAITKIGGKAYINQEQCKECGLCKKVCPYNAISEVMRPCKRVCPTGALEMKEQDKRAAIRIEDCINCGACMAACPFGAISDKSSIVPVARELMKKKKLVAVVAPAIAGQFGPKVSVGQIKDAFLKLGFTDMIEAACGADAVTVHESLEFIERINEGHKYMSNSCCPGFVGFIEKKFPELKENISSTVSPMIATARWIKNKDKDTMVVFVGPCTAKKSEAKRAGIKEAVEYVLTFEEIAALMAAFEIDPEKCENIKIKDGSIFGRGFAQEGGLTAAIENFIKNKNQLATFTVLKEGELKENQPDTIRKTMVKYKSDQLGLNIVESNIYVKKGGQEPEFKPVKVSGFEEINKVMNSAKFGRVEGNFIEGMLCEGGCIGGPATMVPQMKSKIQLAKYAKEATVKSVSSNKKLVEFDDVELGM